MVNNDSARQEKAAGVNTENTRQKAEHGGEAEKARRAQWNVPSAHKESTYFIRSILLVILFP